MNIRVGDMTWTMNEQYGWVNDEDDAAMLTETAMLDRIVLLNQLLHEVSEALGRAWCLGEGYDPQYGWPTGDLTPDVMADQIIARTKENT